MQEQLGALKAGRAAGPATPAGEGKGGREIATREKAHDALTQAATLGTIEVSPRVVRSLVSHAAAGCYGVVGMAAKGLRDGIAERLSRENQHRGVEVEVTDAGLTIELWIIVQYGTRISEVAHNLMSAVQYAVEKSVGVPVVAVNVNVQGIHLEGAGHGKV